MGVGGWEGGVDGREHEEKKRCLTLPINSFDSMNI